MTPCHELSKYATKIVVLYVRHRILVS